MYKYVVKFTCYNILLIRMPVCETSRKERRLRIFENRVFRRIFGPKREEVPGELHNEELNDLCTSPNVIRVIR